MCSAGVCPQAYWVPGLGPTVCPGGLPIVSPYQDGCPQSRQETWAAVGTASHSLLLILSAMGPHVPQDSQELEPAHVSSLLQPYRSPRQLPVSAQYSPRAPGSPGCGASWPLPPRHPARRCVPSPLPLAACPHGGQETQDAQHRAGPGSLCPAGWQTATPSHHKLLGACPLVLHCNLRTLGAKVCRAAAMHKWEPWKLEMGDGFSNVNKLQLQEHTLHSRTGMERGICLPGEGPEALLPGWQTTVNHRDTSHAPLTGGMLPGCPCAGFSLVPSGPC